MRGYLKHNVVRVGLLAALLFFAFFLLNLNYHYIPQLMSNYMNYELVSLSFRNFLNNIFFYLFIILIFGFICKRDFETKLEFTKSDYYIWALTLISFVSLFFLGFSSTLLQAGTVIFFVLLCISFFGLAHMKSRYGDFVLSGALSFATIFVVVTGNLIWFYIAKSIAHLADVFLSNLGYTVYVDTTDLAPIVGVEDFIVKISALCSGIDSVILFSVLFFIFFAFDYELFNKKKILGYYLAGLAGVMVIVISRILILLWIGVYYPAFAIGAFHTNAGWILFLLYFLVFWSYSYPRLLLRKR